MGKAQKENNMIKRKLFVAGMTAFAITTATGIAALASQGDVNRNAFGTGAQNQYFAGQNFSNQTDGVFDKGMMNDNGFDRNDFSTDYNSEIGTANNGIAGQGFKAGDNEMSGQSFDTADNNSDEKPVLPRKSDEEAMKEEIKETQEIANTDPTPYTLSIYICILQVE